MNNETGNSDMIKRINRSLILEMVKENQPISRAQIAKKLSLSKTTVSALVDELLKKQLVVELGESNIGKGGGRPACMLGYNPSSAFLVGVDIGGTKILVKVTDLAGNLKHSLRVPTTNKVDELAGLVTKAIEEAELKSSNVIGVGIGVPGTVNDQGVVIQSKALRWSRFDLHGEISLLSYPVFIGNDVNCAAMGERWLGSGENADNMIFIAIGTGIGSAIISNSHIISGQNNRAGEICYLTSRHDMESGLHNNLGKPGVLESKVSGTALSHHGYPSCDLFKAYSSGDEHASAIIRDFLTDLSIAIANMVSLLNPEKVVIGGGVSESMGMLVDEIREMVHSLTPIKTKIDIATLGGDAGALGAIAFALYQVSLTGDVSEMVL